LWPTLEVPNENEEEDPEDDIPLSELIASMMERMTEGSIEENDLRHRCEESEDFQEEAASIEEALMETEDGPSGSGSHENEADDGFFSPRAPQVKSEDALAA